MSCNDSVNVTSLLAGQVLSFGDVALIFAYPPKQTEGYTFKHGGTNRDTINMGRKPVRAGAVLGTRDAYTPTVIGADGTVYAINNAALFATRGL